MGNGESTYNDDSHEDFYANFHPQPSFHHQPPSDAGSSMDHNPRPNHPSARIGDNYSSLDEVLRYFNSKLMFDFVEDTVCYHRFLFIPN